MTRIERILKNARMVLADPDGERWTDDALISMLDEGHKDLCQHSKILRGRADVYLTLDSPYFNLPDDCWQLTRATYNNRVLPFVSHAQLDNAFAAADWRRSLSTQGTFVDWQEDKGEPEALIYDRLSVSECKVYPIPTTEITIAGTLSSPFGVAAGLLGGTVTPAFGVAEVEDQVGVLTAYPGIPHLICYYIRIPEDIESAEDELATHRMFDTALKYYVIGSAFLTDIAEEYQAKGLQQLGYYSRELELAVSSAAKDNQRSAASQTSYRTGF